MHYISELRHAESHELTSHISVTWSIFIFFQMAVEIIYATLAMDFCYTHLKYLKIIHNRIWMQYFIQSSEPFHSTCIFHRQWLYDIAWNRWPIFPHEIYQVCCNWDQKEASCLKICLQRLPNAVFDKIWVCTNSRPWTQGFSQPLCLWRSAGKTCNKNPGSI